MATIGNIVANLGINSTAWSAGLRTGKGHLDKFQRSSTSGFASVTNAANIAKAAIAGLVSARIVTAIKSQMNAIDKLAKTADRLGVSTQALAGLRHAAELTGAGTETLDNSLEKMVVNIAKAADGSGAASKALDSLGLSASTLMSLSPDQQFRTIADSLNGVENSTEKVRLAYEIFGRSGTDLINTLALGSSGLQQVADDADKLGMSVSRIDAAKVEAANDAWYRMQAAVTGLVTQLTVELAPIIKVLSDYFTEMIADSSSGIYSVTEKTSKWADSVGFVMDVFHALSIVWKGTQALVTRGVGLLIGTVEMLAYALEKIVNLLPGMSVDFTSTLTAMRKDVIDLADEQSRAADAMLDVKLPSAVFKERYKNAIAEAEAAGNAASEKLTLPIQEAFNEIDFAGAYSSLTSMFDSSVKYLQEAASGIVLDVETKVTEGESPRSLQRNSAEFFRTINTEFGRGQQDVAKKQVDEQKQTNKLLSTLIDVSKPTILQMLNLGG